MKGCDRHDNIQENQTRNTICPTMGRNRTTKTIRRKKPMTDQNQPNTETQGKNTNPMENQQETKEKLLRVMTGLPKRGTRWARA
jgi:hypothetical protein